MSGSRSRARRRVLAATCAAIAASLAASPALATRFRRPTAQWVGVSAHFDNNGSAAGCQDYNCGRRCYDGHHGTDFPVALGTTVLAVADGRVVATHNGCPNYGGLGNTCGGSCGNYVFIQHADGNRSVYCHMHIDSILVTVGQTVRCGQAIGRSASSGSSTGPHVHLAWRRSSGDTDEYRGQCTTSPGVWVDQNGYGEPVGAECECPAGTASCENRDAGSPPRDSGAADRPSDRPRPDGGAPDGARDSDRTSDPAPPTPDPAPTGSPPRGGDDTDAGDGVIIDDLPDDSGCGCHLGASAPGSPATAAFILLFVLAARSRRRRG